MLKTIVWKRRYQSAMCNRILVLFIILLAAVSAASAGPVVWNNGAVNGDTGHCDSSPDLCGGVGTAWIVYGNFNWQPNPGSAVAGFTYNDYFYTGGPADYLSTDFTIWDSDPFVASAPIYSGSAVATLSGGDMGSTLFQVGNLNISLAPGTYWLGISNVLADDGALTTRGSGAGNGLPGFKNGDASGFYQFDLDGDTAFSVVETPEPSTFSLAALALAALAWKARRRS